MNNTRRLLERIRLKSEPQSKNQVAKLCGIPRSSINGMYNGKRFPNQLQCIEISRLLRIDLGHVLSYIAEDKARSEETRAAARRRAPRLHTAAGFTVGLAAAAITFFHSNTADAAQNVWSINDQSVHHAIHYAKYRKWALSAVFRIFLALIALPDLRSPSKSLINHVDTSGTWTVVMDIETHGTIPSASRKCICDASSPDVCLNIVVWTINCATLTCIHRANFS